MADIVNGSIVNGSTVNGSDSGSRYQPASKYQEELMSMYIWPFALVVIYTILGTIGNAVVLYIYTFRWKKTKSRIFIISLAIFNFINSIFDMPVEAYILYHPLQFDNHWLCKTTRGTTFVINNVCPCIFVAIAIDRMLLVYRPLRRIAYTVRYAKQACFIAFVVGVFTGWPGYLFYGTATVPEQLDSVIVLGKTCYVADYYLKEENIKWPSLFNTILFALMVGVYALLIVMYIFIGKKIYQVTKCDLVESRIKVKRISKNKSIIQSFRKIAIGSVFQKSYKPDSKNRQDSEPVEREPAVVIDDNDRRSISFEDSETVGQSQARTKSLRPEPNRRPARMSRRISSVNSQASTGNTITMLLITVAYMLSFLPYVIIVSLRYYDKNYYFTLSRGHKIAYHVFLRSYFLNSVINPMIYSFTNKEFRGVLSNTTLKIKRAILRR